MNLPPGPVPVAGGRSLQRVGALRAAAFFMLWLVLMPSLKPGDLVIGALATAAATALSLRLLPPACGWLDFRALFALLPHFLWESLRAAVDVARRVFSPSLPLRPGFVRCPLGFPPGLARNTFATITSLMPGSVPAGEDDSALDYHCLDTTAPVVEQLWQEERLLAKALVAGRRHG
jgi:multicomponent Na+:H+ antiporter subunit E